MRIGVASCGPTYPTIPHMLVSLSAVDQPPELARGQLRGPDPPRRQLLGDHFEDLLVAQAAALELAVPAPDEVRHRLGEVPHDVGHHPRRLAGAQRRAAHQVCDEVVVRAGGHVEIMPASGAEAKIPARIRAGMQRSGKEYLSPG